MPRVNYHSRFSVNYRFKPVSTLRMVMRVTNLAERVHKPFEKYGEGTG